MKKILSAILFAALLMVAACTPYDDTDLRGQLDNLESRVDSLDAQLQRSNANLMALQTIVEALENKDYITSVEDVLNKENEVVGYTITFANSGPVTIYNGTDGLNGEDGEDGKIPVVGVALHEAGEYCWQLDGEWICDETGNPLPVSVAAPQLRINDQKWEISYDGISWTPVEVIGSGVINASFHFKNVLVLDDQVVFEMVGGQSFSIPLRGEFSLKFDKVDGLRVGVGEEIKIPYTVQGADEETDVYVVYSGTWKASVAKTDHESGFISVVAPDNSEDMNGTVLVGASNHSGQSDLCVLQLSSETLVIEHVEPDVLPAEGGDVFVKVSTNVGKPEVKITYEPGHDAWLEIVPESKAMQEYTLHLKALINPYEKKRIATVSLWDAEGNELNHFAVTQAEKHDFNLQWVYSDASVTGAFGYGEPAIADDGSVYVITTGNTLVKIDASGKKEWTKKLEMWGETACLDVTPSIDPLLGTVYAAGGTNDVVGVYALRALDGKEKWTVGFDEFFPGTINGTLSFWKSGVAVGDDHLFVAAYRGHSINAFSKTDGSRTSYLSSDAAGTTMNYNFTNAPVLTKDGVVAAKSSAGMAGGNRLLMENPVEDFKTTGQDYYVPNGLKTTYRNWSFTDRAPAIAVEFDGRNYVVSGGTESNNHHFHVWYQASERGLGTTIPTPSLDYNYTIAGLRLNAGTGGGGLVAGARNEVIVSADAASDAITAAGHPYTSAGFVAVWPAKKSMNDAFAYKYDHDTTVPGSCAVDNNGYIHMVDIKGGYCVLQPVYESNTVNLVKKTTIYDIIKSDENFKDVTSVEVKSSVKMGKDGKLYVNATLKKDRSTIGATICFTYAETTGICPTSSWPQAGADPMNTNRQVGYKTK